MLSSPNLLSAMPLNRPRHEVTTHHAVGHPQLIRYGKVPPSSCDRAASGKIVGWKMAQDVDQNVMAKELQRITHPSSCGDFQGTFKVYLGVLTYY